MSPLFVGRARELAVLGDALDGARAGTASTVLVGGEAGVGKTRLVRELAERADDALVLVGGCLELGTEGLPFAPFTAVLRGLVRELGRDGVAALVPGGSTQRSWRGCCPSSASPTRTGRRRRARLFEQVLGLLERLAEDQPVVLIVEDAHWADRSTRDLLSFLVRYQRGDVPPADRRHLPRRRAAPRAPAAPAAGRARAASAGSPGWSCGRLTRREVVEQAASILEREPSACGHGPDLRAQRGQSAVRRGAAQRGRAAATRCPSRCATCCWPAWSGCPRRPRSCCGWPAWAGSASSTTCCPPSPGWTRARWPARCGPAVAGNVLVVDGEGYAFRHALIREALHDDLLPGEHTRLHTRFAEALERDLSILPAPRGADRAGPPLALRPRHHLGADQRLARRRGGPQVHRLRRAVRDAVQSAGAVGPRARRRGAHRRRAHRRAAPDLRRLLPRRASTNAASPWPPPPSPRSTERRSRPPPPACCASAASSATT